VSRVVTVSGAETAQGCLWRKD